MPGFQPSVAMRMAKAPGAASRSLDPPSSSFLRPPGARNAILLSASYARPGGTSSVPTVYGVVTV